MNVDINDIAEKEASLQMELKKYRRTTAIIWIIFSTLSLINSFEKGLASLWIIPLTVAFYGLFFYIFYKGAEGGYRRKIRLPDRSPMPWYFSPVIFVPTIALILWMYIKLSK